ncbi:hypothetical protein NHQ30_003727 [Ciborinia camelliae]|nr:hypothetical protein NHQ30_003727 [Ciborinia camelliae]
MMNANSDIDPSLLINTSLSTGETEVGFETAKDEGSVLNINEDKMILGDAEQAEGYSLAGKDNNMLDIDMGGGLSIDMMSNNNGSGSNNSNLSLSNEDREYCEQEYSERVSEDEEISESEYSDEDEDTINIGDTLNEAAYIDASQSAEAWNLDDEPLIVQTSSPRSPPSYSPPSPPSYAPPPTPVLSLAPLFPPGFGMPSVSAMAFFHDPVRYTPRINARKVRMHNTDITIAEHRLRQLPGMWRRFSKVPTSLRRCWTPYDMFDQYLDNTLVAVHDYRAEDTEMDEDEAVIG